jgi:hypothetical protein
VDAVKQVSSIELKLKKLIDLYNENRKKLSESRQEIQELKRFNEEQSSIIKNLKEKTTLIKIAKTTENKEGIADAKLKINELVREIDKCIGLLQT